MIFLFPDVMLSSSTNQMEYTSKIIGQSLEHWSSSRISILSNSSIPQPFKLAELSSHSPLETLPSTSTLSMKESKILLRLLMVLAVYPSKSSRSRNLEPKSRGNHLLNQSSQQMTLLIITIIIVMEWISTVEFTQVECKVFEMSLDTLKRVISHYDCIILSKI